MAKAVAQGAPERLRVTRRTERFGGGLTGNARILAEPAYRRLVDAEPVLRRLIPALIIIFLVVMAAARCLSLMTWRDDVERNAKAILSLSTAHLVNAMSLAATDTPLVSEAGQEMLQKARQIGSLSRNHVVVLTDGDFKVVAVSPEALEWLGKPLDGILSGGQPLFIFGDRAGAMAVDIDGREWFATVSLAEKGGGAAAALVPADAVFAEWRRTVSLNVTLFVLTGGVLIVILYAYFSQATRAQTADRIYVEAHQRIDLALVRGRCGLWDWDMVRGQMYWSRSMYDMLGYKPCEDMLSFGEVDQIIHPDDGNLFKLANKIVSREVDHIDQVFRMRHADGRWVWIRARAQVVDPEAPELHLIGIAVDVTEQRHLAQRSETADLRLRSAIENISESFVLWDSAQRLVMCNSKYQQDYGLSDADVLPGTSREHIAAQMADFMSDRRLASPHGPNGGATYERHLADGRWLQVNELKTRDGGFVSVGTDITLIKQHQAKLLESERRQMAIITDLSASKRAEQERARELSELNREYQKATERAEAANRSKSEFLANMSHELRTPLNAVLGFSELIKTGVYGPLGSPRYAEYIDDIYNSGTYLLGLINDILDMSKIEAGQFVVEREDIDLAPLINETVRVVSLQAAEKQITVDTKIADALQLHADRRAIKQIVMNLLSNAVKFTGKGGRISVRARHVSGALMLTIEDTGCGIPKQALRKLGRPFEQVQNQFTKSHNGSGLGLAISRSLAELHGGALKIRSTEGVGTIVSVRIPTREPKTLRQAA